MTNALLSHKDENPFFEQPSLISKVSNKQQKKVNNNRSLNDNSCLLMTQHSEVSFQEKNYNFMNSDEKNKQSEEGNNIDTCIYKRKETKEPVELLSFGEFMDALSKEMIKPTEIKLEQDKHLIMEYLFKLTSN